MRLEVLGCSGGIGGADRTTCFWVDEDILIDAGTGLSTLSLAQLCSLEHVFITHSHMDHIALLPLLADSVGHIRQRPIRVYATEATIRTLQENVFNWRVWPDFTRIPHASRPFLEFVPIMIGHGVDLGGRRVTAIPANHVVPTVGYHLDSGSGSLIFSGDTTVNEALWTYVNGCESIRYLVVECAFPNRDRAIAVASKHYCPTLLLEDMDKLRRDPQLFITHAKPGETQNILREIAAGPRRPSALSNGQLFDF